MVDIARNAEVRRAIVRSWTTGKLVTAVCHGPCSLLGVDLGDGAPFVRGKKLTAFSKKEEYDYAREDVPYELEDALRAEGADYSSAENWQPKVVVDGRLMTGQNRASAAGPRRQGTLDGAQETRLKRKTDRALTFRCGYRVKISGLLLNLLHSRVELGVGTGRRSRPRSVAVPLGDSPATMSAPTVAASPTRTPASKSKTLKSIA